MKKFFQQHEHLHTSNCTLRAFRPDDREKLARIANNPKIADNLRDRFPSPYSPEDAGDFINNVLENDQDLILAIEVNDQLAGAIALNVQSDIYRHTAELGYWLGYEYWNRGIMTEAVKAIVNWAFENTGIVRIYSGLFSSNPASARVLEKCGFHKEAILRNAVLKHGKFLDEYRYVLLKNQI
jgi:RimJ/RimL family protein N-acetyltransferase